MRNFFRRQLERSLAFLARRILARFKPSIIGVTGSVGKTSTREAIYAVLRTAKRVRRSHGNFNTEIGLPLTIIGEWQSIGGGAFWLNVLCFGVWQWLGPRSLLEKQYGPYPEVLVLEYGADKPGDIRKLVSIARPDIAVVTAIGSIPVHVQAYDGPDSVVREKGRLVEAISSSGVAVLNFDENRVYDMREKTRGRMLTFGFVEGADVRITSFENKVEGKKGAVLTPIGVTFKLEQGGSFVPVRLPGTFGKAQAYAAAAAAAVAVAFNLNLVKIADALSYYQPPGQRMKFLAGIHDSFLLDDSYNASPISVALALETLGDLKAKRRIAVLGEMRELGEYALSAHQVVGQLASQMLDLLITVGDGGKLIADAALSEGMTPSHVKQFTGVAEASNQLKNLIKAGDFVLIKASHAAQFEKIVAALRR